MPHGSRDTPWWEHRIFYQIYPSSFADSNGDGIGDIPGIINHIDYLAGLGVGAIWLSPIYPSPMRDGGYDVQDYENVNPLFGRLADIDRLLQEAHARDIKLILDWVPNHTSNLHPWFIEASASRDNPRRNWYIWRDQPNNWRSNLKPDSAWTLDPHTKQYYLHSYLPAQPDLNWDNPEVVTAMLSTLRFWLDRGIDGFRADTINMIAKDGTFHDLPITMSGVDWAHFQNLPKIHRLLRKIRHVLDEYPSRPIMIGELWLNDPEETAAYYGHGDELDMLFNFRLCEAGWQAEAWRDAIRQTALVAERSKRWPSPVLGNHDIPRVLSRYGSEEQARAAAVVLFTLPGSPFIYAGDELGMADTSVHNRIDPGGRDGSRAPIPWTSQPDHGWPHPHMLPFPPNADRANYETQQSHTDSMLGLYRRLIQLYREQPDLRGSDFRILHTDGQLLAYTRGDLFIAVNFSDQRLACPLDDAYEVLCSTGHATDRSFEQPLEPFEAVVLRRMVG